FVLAVRLVGRVLLVRVRFLVRRLVGVGLLLFLEADRRLVRVKDRVVGHGQPRPGQEANAQAGCDAGHRSTSRWFSPSCPFLAAAKSFRASSRTFFWSSRISRSSAWSWGASFCNFSSSFSLSNSGCLRSNIFVLSLTSSCSARSAFCSAREGIPSLLAG